MKAARAPVAAAAAAGATLVLIGVAIAIAWADLDDAARATLASVVTTPRIALGSFLALAIAAAAGALAYALVAPTANAVQRVAEATRLIAHGNAAHRITAAGHPGVDAIAAAVNDLADARAALATDVERTVAAAKARIEEQRQRLAALVAELDQSVLVCNRDGRILLYNAAAQRVLGANDRGDALGLGRPVSGVLDEAVVTHAVEALERRIERDSRESAHFVTATSDGRLLRVRAAPIVDGDAPALAGYVLLLADVTDDVDAESKRVALVQELVQTTRASLANIRAAIETLASHPDIDAARRARFTTIIHDESQSASQRIVDLAARLAPAAAAQWPLEEMRGEDLLTLARSRIERRTGVATRTDTVDGALWLRVDSFAVAQALAYVAQRLRDEFDVREMRFRLAASGAHAQLDAVWRGPPVSSETAFAWQSEPLAAGGEDSTLTLAQIVARHGGEAWYQRDVPTQTAYFRFLLPLAGGRGAPREAIDARPEFYDFDLFRHSPATDALDSRPLADLAYTVFDTETTGLDPASGDEIIAIGAVRIVNGRLLKGEAFSSLIEPLRALSQASIAVHGITADVLTGQPRAESVLPRFRRFAEETVLVGHNAAFDMRFLQLAETRSGVRFDMPVLDTLLLDAVVHPAQASHSLEEIAARVGVDVVGRHTALGDAMVTAQVFLRLLPLLAERGVRTLGDARVASERTYYARLEY